MVTKVFLFAKVHSYVSDVHPLCAVSAHYDMIDVC